MINTPEENNAKLTAEQTQAIAVSQQRLRVLESEIVSATKVLSALKSDSVVAIRDTKYQEELLLAVSEQVSTATVKLDTLNENLQTTTSDLATLNNEISTKGAKLNIEVMELKEREDECVSKENNFSILVEQYNTNYTKFETEKEYFNKQVAKLKEVISTF